MNPRTAVSMVVLASGWFLIWAQATAAWLDGFLTSTQMCAWGVRRGFSFMQHGGMWADFLLVSPLVAWLVAHHVYPWSSPTSMGILAVSVVLWSGLVLFLFIPMGAQMPEAHAHGGQVTAAGWIHLVYAILRHGSSS
ncbi:MAG TPA: hypothetical protein VF829_00935 [Candidatus Paceibacterota bacterium]